MKKLFMLAAMMLSANTFAAELTSYSQVQEAVVNGHQIRIAADFSRCKNDSADKNAPQFNLGIFSPNSIVVYKDGSIKTALKHFTLNHPTAPGKAVYQYVVYTITPNNNVKLSVYALDATNYKMLGEGSIFNCTIADGAKFYHF